MNLATRFKSLPKSTKNLLTVGILLALVAALPLFIWGVVTQKFLISQKAATGEPWACAPQGMQIVVTPPGGSGDCHDIQTAINSVNGDGYTVKIMQGTYEISGTISVHGKSNITIQGPSWEETSTVLLNFTPGTPSSGQGILITNSSGQLNFISMYGTTPNGMLSIQDSNNFHVGRVNINSIASHAVDVQRSYYTSIDNANIQSSAGAIEVTNGNIIYLTANRIQNSDNAISVNDSSDVNIHYNIINSNRESAVRLYNVTGLRAEHNTIVNNGTGSSYSPAVDAKGQMSGLFQISKNIIVFNQNGGINYSGTASNISGYFSNNDLFMNDSAGSPDNINYVGVPNQTGLNGNISQDPLINFSNAYYCLNSGSPAIYGNLNLSEFMGRTGPCGTEPTSPPTPTPSPVACTQDARICPDGSVVGRVPPNCNFAPCPATSPSPTSSATPTATPSTGTRSFGILFKFAGVGDGSADGAKVTVRFVNPNWGSFGYATPPIVSQYIGSGIYSLRFTLFSNGLPAQGNYSLVLKGEKHEQVKFCQPQGQTTHCSASTTGSINITNTPGIISFNFTGIPLPPGDTYPQDGIINYVDYGRINAVLAKPYADQTEADKMTADLDYNDRVDIRDMFLFRKGLETRYDEY